MSDALVCILHMQDYGQMFQAFGFMMRLAISITASTPFGDRVRVTRVRSTKLPVQVLPQGVLFRLYLGQGLTKAELARMLAASRRAVCHWIDTGGSVHFQR